MRPKASWAAWPACQKPTSRCSARLRRTWRPGHGGSSSHSQHAAQGKQRRPQPQEQRRRHACLTVQASPRGHCPARRRQHQGPGLLADADGRPLMQTLGEASRQLAPHPSLQRRRTTLPRQHHRLSSAAGQARAGRRSRQQQAGFHLPWTAALLLLFNAINAGASAAGLTRQRLPACLLRTPSPAGPWLWTAAQTGLAARWVGPACLKRCLATCWPSWQGGRRPPWCQLAAPPHAALQPAHRRASQRHQRQPPQRGRRPCPGPAWRPPLATANAACCRRPCRPASPPSRQPLRRCARAAYAGRCR